MPQRNSAPTTQPPTVQEDDTYRVVLRVPRALAEDIQGLAKRNRRSLNSELTVALEQYVESFRDPLATLE